MKSSWIVVAPLLSLGLLGGVLFGVLAGGARAESAPDEIDALPPKPEGAIHNPELTGEQIYQRVLDNRFYSYEQELEMESGDQGGNFQVTEIRLKYLSLRHKGGGKILSKTITKYDAPQDVRHLGYLVINKQKGTDDQFIYRPSTRKVRRINLRGEAVSGTDFAFEDVVPQELEDATYRRLPDEKVGEIGVYVVEVTPTDDAESEYSKFVSRVTRDHYVPLRTEYWDNRGVKAKQMTADPDSLTRYVDELDGEVKEVWVTTRTRMEHLQLQSFTELRIEKLEPDTRLRDRDFSERELARSH